MMLNKHILFINNRDRKILIGELRLKAASALIIFLIICLIIASVTGMFVVWGNPSQDIIKRAYTAILVVFILDAIIFSKIFFLVIDLIRSEKVRVYYDGINHGLDKSQFMNMTELLSKLSKSGNFEKIDFNQTFFVELSKFNKEILYIEQSGKIIYPKQI